MRKQTYKEVILKHSLVAALVSRGQEGLSQKAIDKAGMSPDRERGEDDLGDVIPKDGGWAWMCLLGKRNE